MFLSTPCLSSTQNVLKAGVKLAWPHSFLLVADRQTGGRGRQGRQWLSPAGNFYGSYLYRGEINPRHLGWLSLAVGVSVIEALKAVIEKDNNALGLNLKWPNDLLLQGKKLAGLLIEREGDAIIIGLGVNLQHAPPITDGRYQSISLQEGLSSSTRSVGEPKKVVILAPQPTAEDDKNQIPTSLEFAKSWQSSLQHWLSLWQQQDFATIKTAWLQSHPPLGTPLQIKRDDEILQGIFAGLADDGALQLQTATELVTLHTADVFFLASY